MRRTSLGDQELELLRFVSENGSVTAGEAAAKYGEPNGLARSTVETVMSRLHKKGYLDRVQTEAGYRYQPTMEPQDVVGGLIERFVEKTLGGSMVPLVNYFVRQEKFTEEEIAELQQLVQRLESKKPEKP